MADKGIASKVPSDYWNKPHAMIVKAMQKGHHVEGIIEAIETIAAELAQHFPPELDDSDELPNEPKIVE